MSSERLGLIARLWLAFVLPWKLIFSGKLAARVRALTAGDPAAADGRRPPSSDEAAAPTESVATGERVIDVEPETVPEKPNETGAVQLLAILQREGRLIDFLQEDVAAFSDADIGAAARVVHEGVKRGLSQYVDLAPIRSENEGDELVLEAGFDASRVRVTGNVVGEPPFKGRLAHPGWQVSEIRLPTLAEGQDPRVVAPAEVEL